MVKFNDRALLLMTYRNSDPDLPRESPMVLASVLKIVKGQTINKNVISRTVKRL